MDKDKVYQSEDKLPSTFLASVDIIIPFHGQYKQVEVLLDSIFRLTRSNYYNVCIVDDASPNSSFIQSIDRNAKRIAEKRKSTNIVKTIRLDEQRGFAGAAKAGLDQTENPYVCFVNSDCKIETINWLRKMGECLLNNKDQGVRMVAPLTNNHVDGHEQQLGTKESMSEEIYVLKDGEFLSLYCFMCHRELFTRCGGFLKEYEFGYYEDVEFAKRMQKFGFKQAVCKSSWIYHEGQSTIKPLWRSNPESQYIMEEENRKRCIEDMKKLIK